MKGDKDQACEFFQRSKFAKRSIEKLESSSLKKEEQHRNLR